ncbi:probable calcium-binding protein CML25/26 [Aegilops tauschii subsp. strangulata]|nr:probable calcium-binding protein CML25/26 [Aegilops tauschii subsp. strangulata]
MNSHSIMAVPSVFAAFDKDGDGKVSTSELRRCMEATLGEYVSEEEAVAALAVVDTDGDGLLNQEEFSRLAAGAHEEDDADVKRRCLREAFGIYASSSVEDTATTTMITPASLRRTLSRLGSHELGVEECRAMICRFDLDGDGKLSFDEFQVMMMA